MLGEDADWLCDVATEMDQEDGLIWVYNSSSGGVMAFTDFGIETLAGLVQEFTKPIPARSSEQPTRNNLTAAYAEGLRLAPTASKSATTKRRSGSRRNCSKRSTRRPVTRILPTQRHTSRLTRESLRSPNCSVVIR